MKLNLKAIAAAVVVVATGSAHANIVGATNGSGTGTGSSLVIAAFDTVTKSAYYRDTGFLLNQFLPSSVTTGSGDGAATGNKTPEAGLLLDKNNTASFADSAFSTWLSSVTLTNVKWTAFAGDSQSLTGTSNVSRLLLANSQVPPLTVTNSSITNAVPVFTGLTPLSFGLSTTQATVLDLIEGNLTGQSTTLGTLGQASNLFYYARTTGQLANSTPANATLYQNSLNVASLTLGTNGDLVYSLAAASAPGEVPVPAAAWLLGSGLLAIGGAARRRKAAAQV